MCSGGTGADLKRNAAPHSQCPLLCTGRAARTRGFFCGQRNRAHEPEPLSAAPSSEGGQSRRASGGGVARPSGPVDRAHPLAEHDRECDHPCAGQRDCDPIGRRLSAGVQRVDSGGRAPDLLRGRAEDLRRAAPRAARSSRRLRVHAPPVGSVSLRVGDQPARERRAAPARHVARASLEFAEHGGAAHRGRRGGCHDSEAPPANAREPARSGEGHGRGHHGAARRDRRDRRRRSLGDDPGAVASEPAHAPAGVRGGHRAHRRRAAHEARSSRARARPLGSREADRGGDDARCLLRPVGHAAEYAAFEFPAGQAPHGIRGR